MDMDNIEIGLDGFVYAPFPKEREWITALDSWWLLPNCEAYGMSKESLIEAVQQLQTLSASEFANQGHQLFTSPEVMKSIEQAVSERKIEHVTLVAHEGEVRHELSMEEKVAELFALGGALLAYVSSLREPQSETATFGMGHQRRELVAFWSKDPSKSHLIYANFVSEMVFDVAKDGVLDLIRVYPEICNATPTEFLASLTEAGGISKANLSSPSNFLHAVLMGVMMGRPDLVSSVYGSLAKTLQQEHTEPSDADLDTAKTLLKNKLTDIIGTQYMDGSATKWSEQLIEKLRWMFNPSTIQHLLLLPPPIQRETVHVIYTEVWHKLGKGTAEKFNQAVNRAINEVVESYTWEGVDNYGAVFSELSSEQIREQKKYAENIFRKAKLTKPRRRVLQLELILLWHEAKWTQKEKAKYLGMKEGSYRKYLYEARIKTNSVHYKPKEHNGCERLLQAIFGGTLDKSVT